MHVFPFVHHSPYWDGSEKAAGWGAADALARKIDETALDWPVPLEDVVEKPYPE